MFQNRAVQALVILAVIGYLAVLRTTIHIDDRMLAEHVTFYAGGR